jgi:EAL domain-containing protein (putative c-di-GMP-specific phosphodiesterase class I)
MRVVEKILACLRVPFNLGEDSLTVSACLGIALFPENDKDTPLDILRRSNTALHHAKENGTGQIAFFEGELDEVSKQRFNIERELRQGIENGELLLHLQPQVDAAGKIVGAEALVRWQHPMRGLLPPATFISIAEETDLIVEIGEWVFAEVCRLLVQNDGQRPLRIAVNISPRHFRQPDFVAWVKRGLTFSGADPSQLTLEITEGMVINNISNVIAKMSELSVLGIHFSLDDFGTGYSSLAYLKRLPVTELKIDKSFVMGMEQSESDAQIVRSTIDLAHNLGLTVVAEGVETAAVYKLLGELNCDEGQGYYMSKPVPCEAFAAWREGWDAQRR